MAYTFLELTIGVMNAFMIIVYLASWMRIGMVFGWVGGLTLLLLLLIRVFLHVFYLQTRKTKKKDKLLLVLVFPGVIEVFIVLIAVNIWLFLNRNQIAAEMAAGITAVRPEIAAQAAAARRRQQQRRAFHRITQVPIPPDDEL